MIENFIVIVTKWQMNLEANNPRHSGSGVRLTTCMVGGKAAAEADGVMHRAVCYSALLTEAASLKRFAWCADWNDHSGFAHPGPVV